MKLTEVHSRRISCIIADVLRDYALIRIKNRDWNDDDDPEYELDDDGIDAAAKAILFKIGKLEGEMVAKAMEDSMGAQNSVGSGTVPPKSAASSDWIAGKVKPAGGPIPEPQKGAVSADDGGTGNSMQLGGGKAKKPKAQSDAGSGYA